MDIRRATLVVLTTLTVLATSAISQAKSPTDEDPWLLLDKITHKRTYTIETRDGQCVWGLITAVTPDRLTAKVNSPWGTSDAVMRTFIRHDVLHVGGNVYQVRLYYSGRSSWSDVAAFRAFSREDLKVVAKTGETYDVMQPYTVSDDGIAATASGKHVTFSKKDIARIYAVITKPVTDRQGYLLEELGPMIVFDPYFYEYKFHLEQYVPVLLYDARQPEDNSPGPCEKEWQRKLQLFQRKQVPEAMPEPPPNPAASPHPSQNTSE